MPHYQSRSFNGRRSSSPNIRRKSGRGAYSYPRGGNINRRGPKKDYIDPARFIKAARPRDEDAYTPQYSFADFDVNPVLKQNIAAKGFVVPSPIQDQAIPAGLAGRDVIGVADTGTGKTAAFGVPILQKIMLGDDRVLVIAPTRELAQQIDAEFGSIAKGGNLNSVIIIGGASISQQLRLLRRRPQIVIGTPGRLKDHLERGSLKLHDFHFVVLDEVDRMLDMGFVIDVKSILAKLPTDRQSFFFSATVDARVRSLIESFSHNPVTVAVKTGETGENIHQDVVRISHDSEKLGKLHELLLTDTITKTIIFDDTQRRVERLGNDLIARGFSADVIHGGKTQGQRQRSLKRFKDNEVRILVATDVAARGIDVKDVSHVINYSTPASYSDYVHRIGRAGRAGKVGYALTFVAA